MPDNGQPDLAGYSSVEELVRGYRASSDEAKRLKVRAERADQLEEQFTRQMVPQRGNPVDRLAEYGIPTDALNEYVGSIVQQAVGQAFEPLTRGIGARESILSEYPDYTKFEADVVKFIKSDPDLEKRYQRVFSTDPEAAMELAFLRFGEHKRRETPNGATPQAQARSEAQIPSSRSGDARTLPQTNGQEQLGRAWDHYQKTGDPRPFAKTRLKQVVSDEFLNR